MGRALRALGRLVTSPFILAVFVLPNLVFWSLTSFIPNTPEIAAFNLAVLGVSTAVIIAYGEAVVTTVIQGEKRDSSDYIAAGIVYGFAGLWTRSALSLTWRWLGQPAWLLNSDFINGILFLSMMAGLLHAVARGGLKDGRVPTQRWVRIGIICGAVVVVGMLVLHATDIFEGMRRWTTPSDTAPTPASFEQSD